MMVGSWGFFQSYVRLNDQNTGTRLMNLKYSESKRCTFLFVLCWMKGHDKTSPFTLLHVFYET